jgi:hypothetical protein
MPQYPVIELLPETASTSADISDSRPFDSTIWGIDPSSTEGKRDNTLGTEDPNLIADNTLADPVVGTASTSAGEEGTSSQRDRDTQTKKKEEKKSPWNASTDLQSHLHRTVEPIFPRTRSEEPVSADGRTDDVSLKGEQKADHIFFETKGATETGVELYVPPADNILSTLYNPPSGDPALNTGESQDAGGAQNKLADLLLPLSSNASDLGLVESNQTLENGLDPLGADPSSTSNPEEISPLHLDQTLARLGITPDNPHYAEAWDAVQIMAGLLHSDKFAKDPALALAKLQEAGEELWKSAPEGVRNQVEAIRGRNVDQAEQEVQALAPEVSAKADREAEKLVKVLGVRDDDPESSIYALAMKEARKIYMLIHEYGSEAKYDVHLTNLLDLAPKNSKQYNLLFPKRHRIELYIGWWKDQREADLASNTWAGQLYKYAALTNKQFRWFIETREGYVTLVVAQSLAGTAFPSATAKPAHFVVTSLFGNLVGYTLDAQIFSRLARLNPFNQVLSQFVWTASTIGAVLGIPDPFQHATSQTQTAQTQPGTTQTTQTRPDTTSNSASV